MKSKNVEFDQLFDPDVMGDGPAAAGYKIAGVPYQFAALKYGTKRADVGYAIAGVDVSNLWAAKGTAVYELPFNGGIYGASAVAVTSASGTVTARLTLNMFSDGTYSIQRFTFNGNSGPTVTLTSGTWLPAGESAASYEVQYVPSLSGSPLPTVSNGAAAYSSLSTSRGISTSNSQASASSGQASGTANIAVNFRKVGQSTQVNTIRFNTTAVGFV